MYPLQRHVKYQFHLAGLFGLSPCTVNSCTPCYILCVCVCVFGCSSLVLNLAHFRPNNRGSKWGENVNEMERRGKGLRKDGINRSRGDCKKVNTCWRPFIIRQVDFIWHVAMVGNFCLLVAYFISSNKMPSIIFGLLTYSFFFTWARARPHIHTHPLWAPFVMQFDTVVSIRMCMCVFGLFVFI